MIKKVFWRWLPFAFVGTALMLIIAFGLNMVLRQSANDPQIQMARDTARLLTSGAKPDSVLLSGTVDPTLSLAPFLIITDESSGVLASGAADPALVPPMGSLEFAKSLPENRVTWEPATGARLATVIVHYGGSQPGYVVAARSLAEVEDREHTLGIVEGIIYLGLLVGTFLILWWTL